MPELNFLTDLFEMIAALSALGVTFILYMETRRMRAEMREDRADMLRLRDEIVLLKKQRKD
ncbi:hypothetical protein [Pseudophaeobacter sp. 1A09344]|uniref:hypothetical protein n=1 Tax=Pseudophaeobacter sp. 1A09344 TaxID=3098144 RepID=UPI0034D708A6